MLLAVASVVDSRFDSHRLKLAYIIDTVSDIARRAFPFALALFAGVVGYWHPAADVQTDFSQLLTAAQDWLAGKNPYSVRWTVAWGQHFVLYPFPAILFALPFSFLPLRWAEGLFSALGFGLLSHVLSRDRWHSPALWVFGSVAALYVAQVVQWSMLLTAVIFLPALAFVLVCKPTIGLALFVARPTRLAAIGCAAFMLLSLALYPQWPADWWQATHSVSHVRSPIVRLGGVCVLAALLRWRRAEARLLVALALVPHTPILYEAVPLFLIPQTIEEGAILAGLTLVAKMLLPGLGPYADANAVYDMSGKLMVWLLYLPCTIMVLLRPNVQHELLAAPSGRSVPIRGSQRAPHAPSGPAS